MKASVKFESNLSLLFDFLVRLGYVGIGFFSVENIVAEVTLYNNIEMSKNCPKIVQKLPKIAKNCQKFPKIVQKMPKIAKNCPKLIKIAQN